MLVLFVVSIVKRDNSIVDIGYGIGFILLAAITFLGQDITPSHRSIIITSFVTIWGLRLALRIAGRNIGKPEDFRYHAWRKEWLKRGEVYFLIRSFLQVFVLQGIIILLVALPIILGNTMQTDTMQWYNYAGVLIWIFGFIFEFVGDAQLDRFLRQRKLGKSKKILWTPDFGGIAGTQIILAKLVSGGG